LVVILFSFFEIEFCSPEYELAHRRGFVQSARTATAVDVSHAPGNPNINHD